jgi:hypothetical protein
MGGIILRGGLVSCCADGCCTLGEGRGLEFGIWPSCVGWSFGSGHMCVATCSFLLEWVDVGGGASLFWHAISHCALLVYLFGNCFVLLRV